MSWLEKVADYWDQMVPPPPKAKASGQALGLESDIVFRERPARPHRPAQPLNPKGVHPEVLLRELRDEVSRSLDQLEQLKEIIFRLKDEPPSETDTPMQDIVIEEKMMYDNPSDSSDEIEITLR